MLTTTVHRREGDPRVDALAFAPTVLRNGRRTYARRLVHDPEMGVVPTGAKIPWVDLGDAPALAPYRGDLVLVDVDGPVEYRLVQMLLAEREALTGRPGHVAVLSGGHTGGCDHSLVIVYDPDVEWRRWLVRTLHAEARGTARWPWQCARVIGCRSAKPDRRRPDGRLLRLTAHGYVPITLAEARARVRRVPGADAGGRQCRTRTAAPVAQTASVMDLVAALPTWAQVATRMDPPHGERSYAELRVVRGAVLAGLTSADLHAVLMEVPAGRRWRATGGDVERAEDRMKDARAWLSAHPDVAWHGPTAEDVEAVTHAWDRILAAAAQAQLGAHEWAVLARHRATSITEGSLARWLYSDRDLAADAGIDRTTLRRVERRLPWVRVEARGTRTGGRVATTYRAESLGFPPYQTRPLRPSPDGSALRALCDHLAGLTVTDPWAWTAGAPRALPVEVALATAAVAAGLGPDTLAALTGAGASTVRRWHSRAAAPSVRLITRPSQRSPWVLADTADVVAARLGVTGRASAARAEHDHERAVEDTVRALIAAGQVRSVGALRADERDRTARRAGREAHASRRHSRTRGDRIAEVVWEDPRCGATVWLTPLDLRHGADALVDGWAARWDGGEHREVAAEVHAWQAALHDRLVGETVGRAVSRAAREADHGTSGPASRSREALLSGSVTSIMDRLQARVDSEEYVEDGQVSAPPPDARVPVAERRATLAAA